MSNYTEDHGNNTTTLHRTSPVPGGIVLFLSALNIVLSISATLGNVLILIALHKVSSIYPPTKLLFRCLAITDLCVGLISQPLFVTVMLIVIFETKMDVTYYVVKVFDFSGFILCEVSVLTSTVISVDRLLALLLGLRYRQVVTLRQVRTILTFSWLIAFSCVLMYLFWSYHIALAAAISFATICVVISVISYTKITLRLRQHQVQGTGRTPAGKPNGGEIPLNIARYKKTVSTIAWVQLALAACYVPFIISVTIIRMSEWEWSSARANIILFFTFTLVSLNSSLNPLLYCWKIGEVRLIVKDTIEKIFCLSC